MQKLDWLHVIEVKQLRNFEHTKKAKGIDINLAEKKWHHLMANEDIAMKHFAKYFCAFPPFGFSYRFSFF